MPNVFRCGFARVEITPPLACELIGYDFRQTHFTGNAGVHDPLLARVLVIEQGDVRAALVSLDLCIIETKLARSLRRAVADKIGTHADRVVIACSHTHSGAFPTFESREKSKTSDDASESYAEFLHQKVEAAAASASGLLYPFEMSLREAPLGIGYTRRVRTANGVKHCWNPQESPELAPELSADPTCIAVILRQINGPRVQVLWGVGAHPVTLGKTSNVVSADWPGTACRLIEEAMPQSRAMFFLGACGDVHPWIATQENPKNIRFVARAASAMVTLLAQSGASATSESVLRISTRTVTIGKTELDLAVWRFGSCWLVAVPGELFASLGAELRRCLRAPVLLATVSNGWTGYWPDRVAFGEGGYEVNAAREYSREAGDSERLIDLIVAMADEMNCEKG